MSAGPIAPNATNILVRGVNWLGDAIMTTPALIRLRQARPGARITLLTPAKLAELWTGHPAVDAVLQFENGESVFHIGRKIRRHHFDLAIVLPNSPRSAMEAFLGRVPRRLGFRRPWRTWSLTDPCNDRTKTATIRKRSVPEIKTLVKTQPQKSRTEYPTSGHQILDYLFLMQHLGADPTPIPPALTIDPNEVRAIRERFGTIESVKLFGLNPGAEYGPAKRWPVDRFVETAHRLLKKTNCHWWIFGGLLEVDLAERIAQKLPKQSVHVLAGKTSLRELCAALNACDAVLTNDTGPMHVAAAVGTPVVVPFGSTSPELTAPGWPPGSGHELVHGQAPCAPCFRRECPIDFRCMTSIAVETVVGAVLRASDKRN